MKAPQFATIAFSLDTAKYAARRPEERERICKYYLDRLLAGEEVAQSEFDHYGIKVSIRQAIGKEIL